MSAHAQTSELLRSLAFSRVYVLYIPLEVKPVFVVESLSLSLRAASKRADGLG